MPWPTPQDYNEAIQNPKTCFYDPELKKASPELTPLGLPKAITGGFASVYHFNYAAREWAIRCFLREFVDQHQRYKAINDYLNAVKLPYTVEFEYLKTGIRIQGRWYPALKMEWIKGESLSSYIYKNLGNPAAVLALADKWLIMLKDLKQAGIAHGDLQHGNILVHNGELRMIDYDGMYVPPLEGRLSNEVGHRNYQHPSRCEVHFGPTIDNFSAWVIYASLLALADNPSLWQLSGAGDEYLLFRKEDFENPNSSRILLSLQRSKDPKICFLSDFLTKTLTQPNLENIPYLDGSLLSKITIPKSSVPVGPGWIKGFQQQQPEITKGDSSWLMDYIKPSTPVTATAPGVLERSLTALHFVVSLLLVIYLFKGSINLNLFAAFLMGSSGPLGLFLFHRYRSLVEVSEKIRLNKEILLLSSQVVQIDNTIAQINDERKRLDEQEAKIINEIIRKQTECDRKERPELNRIDGELKNIIAEIVYKRHGLADKENKEKDTAQKNKINYYINAKLSKYDISGATIPGIGDELKKRLIAAGIRTAADISDIMIMGTGLDSELCYINIIGKGRTHVSGIGSKKGRYLKAWRDVLSRMVLKDCPKTLSAQAEAQIRSKYQAEHKALDSEEMRVKNTCMTQKVIIQQKFNKEREVLAKQLINERNKYFIENQELQNKVSENTKLLKGTEQQLSSMKKKREFYNHINFTRYIKRILFLTEIKRLLRILG